MVERLENWQVRPESPFGTTLVLFDPLLIIHRRVKDLGVDYRASC